MCLEIHLSKLKRKRVILFRISDLLIRSKIERSASDRLDFLNVSNLEEAKNALSHDALVICDLASTGKELDILIADIRQAEASMLGFYPHVRAEIRSRALAKGVDYVVPRSGLEAMIRKLIGEKG